MAFLELKNVRIAGISACVPKRIEYTKDNPFISADYDYKDFIEKTGIRSRRKDENLVTSDMWCAAAEKLIADLGWDKKEIDAIISCTQGPDYIAPCTACITQDRLGLPKECYAAEIPLGCSGWVYGLSYLASLLSTGCMKKGLLLVGDARTVLPTSDPIVGFAGTATAVEFKEGADGFKFHFGTDGSGYEAIIIPDGGARNRISLESLQPEDVNGRQLCRLQSRMNGMDVFSFAISTAPKSMKKLAEHFNLNLEEVDYCVLHQANMQIDEIIRNKMKYSKEKVPMCLPDFGNTSSASIPLTIVSQLKGKVEHKFTKFLCCGFGIGLSWGSLSFDSESMVLSDLVEI